MPITVPGETEAIPQSSVSKKVNLGGALYINATVNVASLSQGILTHHACHSDIYATH